MRCFAGFWNLASTVVSVGPLGLVRHPQTQHDPDGSVVSTIPSHTLFLGIGIGSSKLILRATTGPRIECSPENQESRDKAEEMLPFLKGCTSLVTDVRSSYESFATDNGFAHLEIKSSGRSGENGETMNEVNGLMSEFNVWFARFRGVSNRHLQGYLDRFLFQKSLSYAKEVLDTPGAELSCLLKTGSAIPCREAPTKVMPIDLHEAYGKWHYGIFSEE